jgi:PPOX class probable F420-dependent enzyme
MGTWLSSACSAPGCSWSKGQDLVGRNLAHRRGIVARVELTELDLIGAQDHHLAVVATTRADGTVQASVVNAGLVAHPVSGEQVIAFVTYGKAKLANLRSRPRATIVFRAGWQWASAEGSCDIIGPDDPLSGFDRAELPELLRAVFRAAGGAHDDWGTFDRVMRDERRSVVLVRTDRIYSNPS